MNWRLQTTLAGVLAALGLWMTFNPVTVVTAASSYIPWLLLAAAAVQLISIFFRSRRVFSVVIFPAVTGALFLYAGLSMMYGDPRTVGPLSLVFVLALVLFGSGAAKLFSGLSMRRSRYFLYIVGSGAVSLVMGLYVLFNWATVSGGLIGVILGLEVIADAVVMAVLGLRDRDGELAMETLGLDPAAEAAKAEAKRDAVAAAAAAEAAEMKAATKAAETRAAEAKAAEAKAGADAKAAADAEAARAKAAADAAQAKAAADAEAARVRAAADAAAAEAAKAAAAVTPPKPKAAPKAAAKPAAAKPAAKAPAAKASATKAPAKKAAPKPPKSDPETQS